ncbi:MAG TPA: glycolate oxidase subunit GlcE [Alphaproteobacteria bacterium]|nr:glycolate oxidase subunit GlcE [Alphaproteobacteria bacterium]
MAERLRPQNADELLDAVKWAVAEASPLEVIGAGTKRAFGRPSQADHTLDVSRLAGIGLYEPDELVLGAATGTPLVEIEAALAEERQMLAFEPPDLGPLLGGEAGAHTLGGVVGCNLSGPRRIKAGAARDHFLGFTAVSGRGEAFKAGGRVVKNVTGYDICKLIAGSYGTLAVMSALTVKVLPAPEKTRTVLVFGLDDARAGEAMTVGLGSAHEVSGAAHLPASVAARSGVSYVSAAGAAVTALRVEGPGPSVEHRCAALRGLLGGFGASEELHGHNSAAFWREVRDVSAFSGGEDRMLWRISVAPSAGAGVVAAIAQAGGEVEALYDWGGGLVWLLLPVREDAGAPAVRAAVAATGGHATLFRAPADIRAAVEVFQPQDAALAGITVRLKENFDPRGVLNPGRMYAGV